MDNLILVLVASFGAFCQEVLYWYELKTKLENKKYVQMLRSSKYWIVTLLMILVSGLGVWILYADQVRTKSIYFILGASFPLLFKNIVAATGTKGAHVELGKPSVLKTYFQLSE